MELGTRKIKLAVGEKKVGAFIARRNFGRVLKTISKHGVNIVFVIQFFGVLVHFLVKHGRYFSIVNKVRNKFQKFKVV